MLTGLIVATVGRLPVGFWPVSRHNLSIAAVVTILCTGFAVAALHTPIERRVELGSTSERLIEWRAALNQWGTSPVIGVGPDVPLRFHSVDGTFAYFAHNEYLQIAADSGAVGLLLVLLTCGVVIVVVRREDVVSSCACAALVAFAVAGALDFDWHLSVIGLAGGWVAGLASRSQHTVNTY